MSFDAILASLQVDFIDDPESDPGTKNEIVIAALRDTYNESSILKSMYAQ